MGETFGWWTVVGTARPMPVTGGSIRHVMARCRCGTRRPVSLPNLLAGKSKSCGCNRGPRTALAKTIHGEARKGAITSEYATWQAMRRRCDNPNHPGYADYGGRGITVCDRWMKFQNFLADMGRRPPRHSIERKNVNGNYEPDNCCWATSKQQRQNQRRRARLDQFTDADLIQEMNRRGFQSHRGAA